jgi:hypothetical protein
MRNPAYSIPKKLTAEQRRALKMLADASTYGCAEAVLRAQGFDATMLAEMVNAGLVSRMPERLRAGSRSIDTARFRITPAGQGAIR